MTKTDLRPQMGTLLFTGLLLMLVSPRVFPGQKLKLGKPAPDFTVPSLDGQRVIRLSDFRGRRVLIFTWASW